MIPARASKTAYPCQVLLVRCSVTVLCSDAGVPNCSSIQGKFAQSGSRRKQVRLLLKFVACCRVFFCRVSGLRWRVFLWGPSWLLLVLQKLTSPFWGPQTWRHRFTWKGDQNGGHSSVQLQSETRFLDERVRAIGCTRRFSQPMGTMSLR